MRRAFTLIELLIVIAIIAILALIAIPNFLESQTRAKVGRAMADMRSYGMAIEAYTTDYGRPIMSYRYLTSVPPDSTCPVQSTMSQTNARRWSERTLTTPIAYITSIPIDPFCDKGYEDSRVGVTPDSPRQETYNYEDYVPPCWWYTGPVQTPILYRNGVLWSMQCAGPTRNRGVYNVRALIGAQNHTSQPGLFFNAYDPTNGTMSFGVIIRTNKGGWTGTIYK